MVLASNVKSGPGLAVFGDLPFWDRGRLMHVKTGTSLLGTLLDRRILEKRFIPVLGRSDRVRGESLK